MNNNFIIGNIGIGDITFLCFDMLKSSEKDINIQFSEKALSLYRQNEADNYCNFLKQYITKILPDKNLSFNNLNNPKILGVNVNKALTERIFEPKIISHFKNLFSDKSIFIDEPYIVINTKSRYYSKPDFDKNKEKLFDCLNNTNGKIVILGEREVEYNYEYLAHGNKLIYSTYQDLIKFLNPDKVIDLSITKLGLTTPDLNRMISEVSLAYRAEHIINFGGGGFFCLTIMSQKLKALASDGHFNFDTSKIFNKFLFFELKDLINSLKDNP